MGKQIVLVDLNRKSQVDGKVIKSVMVLPYQGTLFSFCDGTWGIIADTKYGDMQFNLDTYITNLSYDDLSEKLSKLVDAGVISESDKERITKDRQKSYRNDLYSSIECHKRAIKDAEDKLRDCDKCPVCHK